MNRFLIFIFSFTICISSIAQESKLTSKYRPGIFWFYTGFKPSKIGAPKYDRLLIEIGHNSVFYNQKHFSTKWYSPSWNTQLLFDIPFSHKGITSLGFGIGYANTKINFNDVLLFSENTFIGKGSNVKQSTFKTNDFFIPVELRFKTAGYKHFKIHIGGKLAYNFRSKYILHNTNNNNTVSENNISEYINSWIWSTHIRAGIRNWAVYASYNLTPYFIDSENKMNLLNIGISLSLF